MRFEVFPRKKLLKRRQWYFRIVASNGQIVAQSEGYHNREDCVSTCSMIRREAGHATVAIASNYETFPS